MSMMAGIPRPSPPIRVAQALVNSTSLGAFKRLPSFGFRRWMRKPSHEVAGTGQSPGACARVRNASLMGAETEPFFTRDAVSAIGWQCAGNVRAEVGSALFFGHGHANQGSRIDPPLPFPGHFGLLAESGHRRTRHRNGAGVAGRRGTATRLGPGERRSEVGPEAGCANRIRGTESSGCTRPGGTQLHYRKGRADSRWIPPPTGWLLRWQRLLRGRSGEARPTPRIRALLPPPRLGLSYTGSQLNQHNLHENKRLACIVRKLARL
jgi:hypothetical protein